MNLETLAGDAAGMLEVEERVQGVWKVREEEEQARSGRCQVSTPPRTECA